MAVVLYLGGFIAFVRRMPMAIGSMKTGELVYTAPDTFEYRAVAVFYSPLFHLTVSVTCSTSG
jgi:hypothetical protein